jgi:hypothetical protein
MKNSIILLASFLFIVLMQSCIYDEDEIYEKNLNSDSKPPDFTNVELSFSMEEDTIVLIQNSVYFHFQTSESEVLRVDFYIDEVLVGSEYSDNGIFDINHEFVNTGYYKLRIEVFTNSGTGSIADDLGIEGFLLSTKEWVIKILESSGNNVIAFVEDGYLKLTWAVPYEEVTEYIIYREHYIVARTSENYFIDKGYVGEGGDYTVRYIGSNDTDNHYVGSLELPNEMEISYEADQNNKYAIQWGQPRFYAAVDSVLVVAEEITYEHTEYVLDVNDGEYVIPQRFFGKEHDYKMMYIPKYYNPVYEEYISSDGWREFPFSNEIDLIVGYPAPKFDFLMQMNESELFYHTSRYSNTYSSNDSIFAYSFLNEKILRRYRYNPPNYGWSGNHYDDFYFSGDRQHYTAVIGLTGTLMYGSSSDFSDFSIHTLDEFTEHNVEISPVANNGIGIIQTSQKINIYDFENSEVLFELDTETYYPEPDISPDGQYFFYKEYTGLRLYELINDTVELVDEFATYGSYKYDYLAFHKSETDKIVAFNKYDKIMYILSCPEMTVLSSFLVPEESLNHINYQTNMILSASEDIIVIRNLDNGDILYEIPTELPYASSRSIRLVDNSIFWKDGARYFLD